MGVALRLKGVNFKIIGFTITFGYPPLTIVTILAFVLVLLGHLVPPFSISSRILLDTSLPLGASIWTIAVDEMMVIIIADETQSERNVQQHECQIGAATPNGRHRN